MITITSQYQIVATIGSLEEHIFMKGYQEVYFKLLIARIMIINWILLVYKLNQSHMFYPAHEVNPHHFIIIIIINILIYKANFM